MEKKQGNKHVIVSGGSKGLGLAMVQSLLESGYAVSSFSRTHTAAIDDLAKTHGNLLHFARADSADAESLNLFATKAIEVHGNVFGLINNSAVAVDGVLATMPEIEIERMLAVNLRGALVLARLCLRSMLKTREGRIINISSIIGSSGYSGLSVYSATKAGLDGMTRSLAREVGRLGITINSIGPGYMKTDMSSNLSDEKVQQIVRRTPLGRLAETGDVVPLMQFLMSEASGFITGQSILVDGGISC